MNRRIVMVTAGAAVALLAVWFFALWQPKGAELSAERSRLDAADAQAGELETRILRLKVSEANRPKLTATLDRLRSAVPDDPSLPQFILDANDAATTSGVAFVSITPQEPTPSTTAGLPPQIGLSIDIEGGYFQVLDFVEKLSDLQRVVVLDAVNATPLGDDGGAPELAVALTGRMFTSALPAGAAPITDAAVPTASTPETTTTTVVPS